MNATISPLKRFIQLLTLDKKDIYQIVFYAIFSGIISLSLPLGIQAIINFIQSGRVSASWIVLMLLVVLGVALVGFLSLMQLRITENLQQKIFVRSSFNFATRLPRIEFKEYEKNDPTDLANRFFDTLTIQKGISKILIDFSASILQIVLGVMLLSVYHPFFIGVGILLLLLLYVVFKFSHKKSLDSSYNESKYKFKTANWLQELARNHFEFKHPKSYDFGLLKNDALVNDYLYYREKHFTIIQRQHVHLIAFKILITLSLLGVGGYLVIQQQMNIGQFVAAEIIIVLVINSVEKIISGLETFYDVLTAVEKIGQMSDLEIAPIAYQSASTPQFSSLHYDRISAVISDHEFPIFQECSGKILAGERIFVDGNDPVSVLVFLKIITGLIPSNSGTLYILDQNNRKYTPTDLHSDFGIVTDSEALFTGTLLENITFNNPSISLDAIQWALELVEAQATILELPQGIDTLINASNNEINGVLAQKIIVVRSIVHHPSLLILDNPLTKLQQEERLRIIQKILDHKQKWTVIIADKDSLFKSLCTKQITIPNRNK